MSRAREIEQTAASWLVRREQPDWSAEQDAALQQWIAESMEHRAAFWRLEIGWEATERLAAMRSSERPEPRRYRWLAPVVAIAASLLIVCSFALLALGSDGAKPPKMVEVATAVGARKQVDLTDGSQITLNTDSLMRAAVATGERRVWLDRGEAFFDVAHDASRPFTVFAGDSKVTVLGTKFSIRRDGDTTIVTVAQGRVRVEDLSANDDQRATVITAGDMIATRGTSMLVAKQSRQWVEDSLSWRQGVLTFDQVTLEDAAREFNRYNRRQIRIRDPKAAAIRIGGSFDAHDIDAFARLLRTAFGLRITSDEDTITIIS
ncbi:MAG: iron dicitrate transport regulator FecR [Sphingomonas sp.]|nr:iron dicitrate transport regulator FecR [Sphingomonas sp.]|tara:strand:+ start:228 stop:1184 length:957 start_codon:yes stop_codon:yes gene_type:complete